jgi:hypothetical protein
MHVSVDLSRVPNTPFRGEMLRELVWMGHEASATGGFGPAEGGREARNGGANGARHGTSGGLRNGGTNGATRLVVMADLGPLVEAYARRGWAAWRDCFPSMSPLLVAFVRRRDDPAGSRLVDRLMRASGCRLWVYKVARPTVRADLGTLLSEFTACLDPEAVVDVRYARPRDAEPEGTVRIEFADGMRRALPWSALELPVLRPALRPETIRVGENPAVIEILDAAGGAFDISAARLRALAAS